ncbi:MAG TPA: YbhB/YbcL family Raf kinase inhibitor-like protein [Devosiaceae bacterium]
MSRFVLAAALALAATPALALDLKSTDVTDGTPIDTKYVCEKYGGTSISPQLSWSGVPADAKSLAIVMFDPDAGTSGHYHWLLADIPASATGIDQGAGSKGGTIPAGATPLPNGSNHANYDGPCPPAGKPHHYQITLYALPDAKTTIAADMKAADIDAALAKAAVAQARITPIYGQ